MIVRPTAARITGLVMLVAAFGVGCSGSDGSAPASETATVTAGATSSATQGLRGAHVHVLGLWSGPEFDSFEAVKSAWEKETGAIVDWEGTEDLPGTLADHMQGGGPRDIAILPNLAMMEQLADDGMLIPLDSVLDMKQVTKDYAPAWIDLGSHKGKLYGIFYKVTNKAAVWYNPKAFAAAGYKEPTTWNEMIMLADTMVADGHAPFSVVAASGPASGWALTDWVSEIVLKNCGPDLYDKWIAAEIPWNHACIKQSFDMFAKVVSTEGYVLGGSQRIIATGDDDGADPLYTDPPTAYMYYLASFAQAFIAASYPDLEPGTDYDVFEFPTINPEYQRGRHRRCRCPGDAERYPRHSLVHDVPRERPGTGNMDQARRLHLREPQRVSGHLPRSGGANGGRGAHRGRGHSFQCRRHDAHVTATGLVGGDAGPCPGSEQRWTRSSTG